MMIPRPRAFPASVPEPTAAPMSFTIPSDHPCLPGHFPGHPLVPGVVLLDEVLARIEAELVEAGRVEAGHGAPDLLRLPQVKFVQPLRPGEAARIELDGAAPRWRFRVLRADGDVLLASGEVVAGA